MKYGNKYYRQFLYVFKPKKFDKVQIYGYLTGKKDLPYKSYIINKHRFKSELDKGGGFLPSYILVNGNLHYIICGTRSADRVGTDNIGDCYVDLGDKLTFEEFMNSEIEGTKIKDMKEFEFKSVCYCDPKDYFEKHEYSFK